MKTNLMKPLSALTTCALILTGTLICGKCTWGAEFVINGDFETDIEEFVVWPGYVGGTNDAGEANPDEVPEWFGAGGRGINPINARQNPGEITAWPGNGGRGINPIADERAPFRDNGDNETHVAFLQGAASIEQAVDGLAVGQAYTLSFGFNARDCCGDIPIGTLLLNGAEIDVPEFTEDIFPVGGIEPWYSAQVPFTAESQSLVVGFASEPATGGDATLLLDDIQLVRDGDATNLLTNGDFETDADQWDVWPGYTGGGTNEAPFRDNGDNSTAVAFLQGTASLGQVISGLEAGEEYTFSIDFNARNCCGDVPVAELLFDGDLVDNFPGDEFDGGVVEPVGGANPWYHYETTFTASKSDLEILVQTFPLNGGDSTLVIDNVSVRSQGIPGDFDGDGQLTAFDIDLLNEEIRAMTNLPDFDLNGDSAVDVADQKMWVESIKKTYYGDANLDGIFNTTDLIQVFQRGEYEDVVPLNSTWEDGDFNGDAEFNTTDLIVAFQGGGFELGPRAAVLAVPEPGSLALLLIGLLAVCHRRRA